MDWSWKNIARRLNSTDPVVSVVRLNGVIAPASRYSRGLDEASVAPLLEKATKPSRLAAIALAINSPGGSPVQSKLIADRIRAAAKERDVPVFAFCEDVAASGGYMLACAADQIYADRASIVGSIGVISSSFGFEQAIARLGVERRLFTAGAFKARLDPFSRLESEDVAWLEDLQARLHRQFMRFVEESRRDRLEGARTAAIFSGDAFLGEEALELGLIDGFDRLRPKMEAEFGANVRIDVVEPRRGFFSRFSPGVAAPPHEIIAELEARAHWSRFGL